MIDPTEAPMFVKWLRLGLLLAAALLVAPTLGQEETPVVGSDAAAADVTAAVVVEPPADDDPTGVLIRQLTLELEGKDADETTVAKLTELRDARVKIVFDRIQERAIYHWKSADAPQLVYVREFKQDPAGADIAEVYGLFTATDEEGNLDAPPLATVSKSELDPFKESRKVRKAVLASLTIIGMLVDDPLMRQIAARDVGNKRQLDALPKLRELAEGDPDDRVRRTARDSIGLILASGADPSATAEQKTMAIQGLGESRSIRALDLLKTLRDDPNTSSHDRDVLDAAIGRIEQHISRTNWVKNLFFGLSAGSILVLLALGLAVTFGLMGVINMAHGEMLMIGAVTTWGCYEFIGTALPPAWFNWYYVIALPMSFLVAALVGLLTEWAIVRFLYKRPLDSMLATIGLSFVLIQAVRLWKGDNLGMRRPTWFTGGIEVIQDVIFPYNRLFIIALTAACVLGVMALFRFTKIGLMIRATVQNREMAQSLGVNTRLVDRFTFALGAGLAGIAGYAIYLISNPTPEMGQGYIVKSFLVVVVGGVGKLIGVVVSGLGLGFLEKIIEPIVLLEEPIRIFDATWAQVAVLVLVVLFIQRRPSGLFPDKGRMADQADQTSAPLLAKGSRRTDILMGVSLAVAGLLIVPALYVSGLMSLEFVNKLGYILSFAICAIGLDLVWGYIGVMSLCQFLFFSIGGYCMGLYLVNYGPMDGSGKDIPRALYVVMSDVSGAQRPWFLDMFTSFPRAVILGLLLPGLLALAIGFTTFRSRVRGVYFAILTQAITVAFWLIFQKNDLKLGGTNGLTNFTHILGFSIQSDATTGPLEQTRFWLYIVSVVMLLVAIVLAKMLVHSGFGRVLVAIRDDETRLRFVGYQTWAYKAAAFTLAAMFAGLGGMLYVPQKGIITPHQISAFSSILVVAWVAVGGRGTLWGAVIGAIVVNLMYDTLTSSVPEAWLFVLGGLFVLVPLLMPGGIMSLPGLLRKALRGRGGAGNGARARAPVVEGGAA